MRIQLLLTGNELMSGDTVDSNSAGIAQQLSRRGLAVYRKVTVGDDAGLLLEQMEAMSRDAEVLIVNGGLGPTVDDLTAAVLARLLGRPLAEHPEALAHLQRWCERRNYPLDQANRKQALLPEGVAIIANASGSAVGFKARRGDCLIYCTPGVPSELFTMLEREILPDLLASFPTIEPVSVTRLRLFGLGESRLQQRINDRFPDWPPALELGFRAGLPLLELKLTSRARADAALHQHWRDVLERDLADYIIGYDDDTLPAAVVRELGRRGARLCTAESCTGGLIAAQLTAVAGASQVFEAGYVAYANHVKTSALGVAAATLEQCGAVSEAVVREMACGALERSRADLAIAVSGIAGPDGGSPERPVGTVWIAWGRRDRLQAREFYLPGGRHLFQSLAAGLALDLIRRELLGIEREPRYFRERAPQRAGSAGQR